MKRVDLMLEKLKKQSCEHMATIKKLFETDYVNDEKNFNYLVERLQMLGEIFACNVRRMGIKTYSMRKCEVYDNASEVIGIEVHKEGNCIVIDLPPLLPKKMGKQVDFISDPLRYQFEKIYEDKKFKIKEKAVICIIHVYDNVNRKARCYDYDNLESKRILDVITQYTLVDDAPQYCDVYHTVHISDIDKTKIIVMPESDFLTMKSLYNLC